MKKCLTTGLESSRKVEAQTGMQLATGKHNVNSLAPIIINAKIGLFRPWDGGLAQRGRRLPRWKGASAAAVVG